MLVRLSVCLNHIKETIIIIIITYDRTFGIHLMAIHGAAAERGGMIKIKRKKESSWVKPKAFPTSARNGYPSTQVPVSIPGTRVHGYPFSTRIPGYCSIAALNF